MVAARQNKTITTIASLFSLALLLALVFIIYSYSNQGEWMNQKISDISEHLTKTTEYLPALPAFLPILDKPNINSPNATTKTPHIEQTHHEINAPLLTKELAWKYSKDNAIIVTWSNLHFADFILNWVHHMNKNNISNYLVGAMDAETAKILVKRDIPCFAMYDPGSKAVDGLSTAEFAWGGSTFHKMGRYKVDLALKFLEFKLDLCLCDVDTVWIRDPTEYFQSYPEADILASSDSLFPTNRVGDAGLELPPAVHAALNIGLLFFRYSETTTEFALQWKKELEAKAELWDQAVFNELMHQGKIEPFTMHPLNERVFTAWNGRLYIGVLPVSTFASGHTYFVQHLFLVQKVKPYVVHTTFQYGGTDGKRNRMRESLLFHDPPEYYSSNGRYLAFEVPLPSGIADNFETYDYNDQDNEMIQVHFQAMKGQLEHLRNGLALAFALNRTIILPEIVCFCDRYWAVVEQCRIPGARKTKLPFICPSDHYLVPRHFTDAPSVDHPAIQFREFSFLQNPMTEEIHKHQAIVVVEGSTAAMAMADEQKEKKNTMTVVTVPSLQKDSQLVELLAPYSDAPLIRIASPVDTVFAGFDNKAQRDAFMNRFRHILDFWCCRQVPQGQDGGVAYATLFGESGDEKLSW